VNGEEASMTPFGRSLRVGFTVVAVSSAFGLLSRAATNKPPLHAKKWLAITGKPLAATAGAMIFQKGGNAVDAAAAMIAATSTMWDTLSCSRTSRPGR
jgi:gamma-glutamyltranspeptidase/glutathione hydrolase